MKNSKQEDIVNIKQLRLALDNVQAYVYIKDKDSVYLYANQLTQELFGIINEEVVGFRDKDFFPTETVNKLRQIDLKVLAGHSSEEEIVIDYPDLGKRHYLEVKTPIYNDDKTEIIALLGISTDITKQKQLEEQVRQLAITDHLTNLANRRQLFTQLEQAYNRSRRHNTFAALCYLDLDGFKEINDQHGHQIGDDLLVEIANRLVSEVRDIDTVARLGGDEFVILIEDIGKDFDSANNAVIGFKQKLQQIIDEPYLIDGNPISISASIGYELFNGANEARSYNQILDVADSRMYEEKKQRKRR
ncbi:diguanylate cyclase domain-containing protein [Thiomicrorhabdus sediminis]|uniref:Diguanylate cyclase n=1 Tax=Thiomicrorhabdus sediminis TaxID=2580412 RepID=A0A4P9K7Q0_9GAMM|nr:diguanylate cyclase [Thiomicrorhabdus sediminis]QCU90267.1 diguanylate cyclase [Thiomicrorhabdus sediminis]